MRQLLINGELIDAIVLSKDVDVPQIKTSFVEIEGANGSLDLSTVLSDGNALYGDRTLVFNLAIISSEFFNVQSELSNKYHGVRAQLFTSDESDVYYEGRLLLSDWTEEKGRILVTLTAVCSPWKYEQSETVIIAEASAEPGTTVTLECGRKWLSPTLEASQALEIVVGSKRYQLQAGVQKLPGFVLKSGQNTVRLVGSGQVTFRYRNGWL